MKNNLCKSFIDDVYGSKKNFERELIHNAYKNKNTGKLYLKINKLLKVNLSSTVLEDEYTLLTCNLDISDIINFIEDIDYTKLDYSYNEALKLIKP